MEDKKTQLIYYVDKNDNPTGEVEEKIAAHHSETKLHAAFSCYVFNAKGQFLVTRRASSKKVWPSLWTNSCCGHPMPGESRVSAVKRRLLYELGLESVSIEKIIGKTQPMQNWAVTGELRKRLKIAFDKNGIEIPFPQRVIHEAPKIKK